MAFNTIDSISLNTSNWGPVGRPRLVVDLHLIPLVDLESRHTLGRPNVIIPSVDLDTPHTVSRPRTSYLR